MKKIIKIALALIALIMLLGITSKAATLPALPALPALPYVPPSRVQIFDLINNMLGLTTQPITDDQKREQAYVEMMLRYMTQADIDEIVQKARERRKIEIKAGVRDGLQQYALYQVQTGYEEVITPTPTELQEVYNKLLTWQYINENKLPISQFQTMYNTAISALGTNILVLCTYISKGVDNTLVIGFVKNDGSYTFHTGSQNVGSFRGLSTVWKKNNSNNAYQCIVYGQNLGGLWSRGNNNNSVWFGFENSCVATSVQYGTSGFTTSTFTTKGESYTRVAQVQSSAITTALQNSQDIPITANTELVNGAVSTTQTISIDIPNVMPTPAETVNQLQGVQQQLGVVPLPITQDVTATITQLQEMQDTRYGDTEQYELSLTSFFPFCIPYDLYWILTAFVQPPEAPNFDIAISNPFHGEEEDAYFTYHVDLSMFDGVASLFRKFELIIFVVGLCLISRSLILRG